MLCAQLQTNFIFKYVFNCERYRKKWNRFELLWMYPLTVKMAKLKFQKC